jgi:deazaflavin-dependent oxidoreductase (nitroreductase family)
VSTQPLLARVSARALRTRWLVRAPIWLYRAGLGFLLGRRLLMLEHVGRTTGARRYVVLEVVDHPDSSTFVVVSGFGESAQWYRNVLAHPGVRVSCGRHRSIPATAVPMTEEESAEALAAYQVRHPRAWQQLKQTIEVAVGAPVTSLPMVRLSLTR